MNIKGPSFLGIGAQKAGTSWLSQQLSKHPEIWMPPQTGLHFFDRSVSYPTPNALSTSSPLSRVLGSKPWERPQLLAGLKTITKSILASKFDEAVWWSKWTLGYYNEDWYRGLFSQALKYKECGEVSPSYSLLEEQDVARIKSLNPDLKLIFIIRNPIERAWSAIRFSVHRGTLKINLDSDDEIIGALKLPGFIGRGDYERTLDLYLKFFDSSQIIVCFYDAIQDDSKGLMSGLAKFLGVSPFLESDIDNKTYVNRSPKHKMSRKVKDYLIEIYRPNIARMAERFGSYATRWNELYSPNQMKSQEKSYPATQIAKKL